MSILFHNIRKAISEDQKNTIKKDLDSDKGIEMRELNAADEEKQLQKAQTNFPTARDYGIHTLDVTLIRPTNYTDDGYPIKTRLGVIRSNTLTQLGTLVHDFVNEPFFKGLSLNIRKIDEAIEWIPVKEILNQTKAHGVKSIVMLVGVQTNQYPRALDVASKFLPYGIPVLIGGFHVSGMLAMIGLTADLRDAISKEITLVAGEVEEGRLSHIVTDILKGQGKPLYNFLPPTPNLFHIPLPPITKNEFENFASRFTTIDSGRDCVFNCDFCIIMNVQGRTRRYQDPKQVVEFVRQSYHEAGVTHSFFTDDNTKRNPRWREEEKIPFTFMMQSDLAARKIPGGDFFELAAFYAKLSIEMPEIKVPSIVPLWFKKQNPFARAFTRVSDHRIWKRWYLYLWNPFKWIDVWLFELVHGVRFLFHLFYEELEKKPTPFYGFSQK